MSYGGAGYQPTPGAPTVHSVMVNKGNAPFYLDDLLAKGAAAAVDACQGQVIPARLDGRNHHKDTLHPDTVRTQAYEDKVRAKVYADKARAQTVK